MARIRSIKPEFFTSETISSLPLSARLTFIGLWTYVDDNGVGPDNDRLILAAIYPLEDDPTEALRRLSGDLRTLSEAGLIQRYESVGRRVFFVRSWDEHQKVSHPRKERYARPLTCENTDPPERLPRSSGVTPEALRPEQGAGSREQGAGKRANARPAPPESFHEFWAAYPRKQDKGHAEKAYVSALRITTPEALLDAAQRFSTSQRDTEPKYIPLPATWLNGKRWDDDLPVAAEDTEDPWWMRRGGAAS